MQIERPWLADRLDEATRGRLTAVVAGAGYGKTSLISAWAREGHAAVHTVMPADRTLGRFVRGIIDAVRTRVPGLPADLVAAADGAIGPTVVHGPGDEVARAEAYVDHLAEALGRVLVRDLTLVLDDLHELHGAPGSVAVVDGLARQAVDRLHVLVASRSEVPFAVERLRGQGGYAELTGPELAFLPDETAQLVGALLPESTDDALVEAVHRATGGWPAAVRLTLELLRDLEPAQRLDRVRRLPVADDPLYRYLTQEALAAVDDETRRLLTRLVPFDDLHDGLVTALVDGAPSGAHRLEELARQGVWVMGGQEPGWYVMPPLVRGILEEEHEPEAGDLVAGARWFEAHGEPTLALDAWQRHGDPADLAAFLRRRGRALVSSGRAPQVLAALEAAQDLDPDRELDLLWSETLQVRGDWEGALRVLDRHVAGNGPISAELAWRSGLVHHLMGSLDLADLAYGRGALDGGDAVNEALLLAWHGALAWLKGDAVACQQRAADALARAQASGDDAALATAHTVAAMDAALRSDRAANDAHYVRALDHAAAARDLVLTIRVRNNRGSRLLEEGFYEEAIVELDEAIELADLAGFTLFRALALSNRGDALQGLGRLDESVRDLEASRDLHQRLGTQMVGYPLALLGEVYLLRGDRALARGAFEEAVARSEPSGDLQGLVPALAGLARSILDDDPQEAAAVAERAIELGPVLGRVQALLAGGLAARATGDDASARDRAVEAAATARARRDRAGLAGALELLAVVEPDRAADHLAEAAGLWEALRSPIGVARVELERLRRQRPEGAALAVATAEALAERFREMGCRRLAADAAALTQPEPLAPPDLEVRSLGGFGLQRRGEAVAYTEWQSRKARDLLKILVARRGAPVPRDELIDVLWPDEDHAKASRRLSVTLSTLRAVLDPERAAGADHWVVSEDQALRLERAHVAIDVERFLSDAEAGLAAPAGSRERAVALAAAEAAYVGGFLDEDPYAEWAIPLREHARAAYLGVARALIDEAAGRDDHAAAARFARRVLEHDRYDEGAHLDLVRALAGGGHHGMARRAYRTYVRRMAELEVEPVPYPGAGRHPNRT